MTDERHFPELTEAEQIRWRACQSDMQAMSAGIRDGTATAEDIRAALNRLASQDIDRDTMVNALHIPEDAGPHAAALEEILRKIPDGWGRWISHDAGWYPITVDLHHRLAAIDPDYCVHQVKEKFGTLRYYCQPSVAARDMWDRFRELTREAEQVSAITCESCGQPGQLCEMPMRVKTLCATCADRLGFRRRDRGPIED